MVKRIVHVNSRTVGELFWVFSRYASKEKKVSLIIKWKVYAVRVSLRNWLYIYFFCHALVH